MAGLCRNIFTDWQISLVKRTFLNYPHSRCVSEKKFRVIKILKMPLIKNIQYGTM
jgi:hypothetical protein